MVTRRSFLAGGATAALAQVIGGAVPGVKITGIETFATKVPEGSAPDPLRIYRYAVTRVTTDAGVTGTSFIGIEPNLLERWVKPSLVGEDLFAVDRHMKYLQMQSGESRTQSWSGVEHAMWDAIGRLAGRPVAELLGKARDRLRIYRTTVFPGQQDQSDVPYEKQAAFAARLKQTGYTAMKIRAWRPRPPQRAARRSVPSRPVASRRPRRPRASGPRASRPARRARGPGSEGRRRP